MGFLSSSKEKNSSQDKKAALPKGVVLPPGADPLISLRNAAGTAMAGRQGGRSAVSAHSAPATAPAHAPAQGTSREHGVSQLVNLKQGLFDNAKEKDSKPSDSMDYANVRSAIDRLLPVLENKIPEGVEDRAKSLRDIVGLYKSIETSCESFLSRSRIRWTSKSRNRKLYIQKVLNAVKQEKTAIALGNQEHEGNTTWVDVLKEVRIENIDVTPYKIEMEGAGTSVVKHVMSGPDAGYFKKEDRVADSYKEFFKRQFDGLDDNKRGIYKKVTESIFNKDLSTVEAGDVDGLFGINTENIEEQYLGLIRSKYKESNGGSEEGLDDFVQKIVVKTIQYRTSLLTLEDAGIDINDELTKRNVASTRLAELLGVPHLYARSRAVNMKSKAGTEKGTIMDTAKGEKIKKVAQRNKAKALDVESPQLQQSIVCLQMLDTIAGQVDRHMGNVFFQVDGATGTVGSVQGIDNDMSFGKAKDLKKRNSRLKKFFDDKGNYARGLVDREMAEKILNLDTKVLKYAMIDLLSKDEIQALLERVKAMQETFRKMLDSSDARMVSSGGWNKKTAEILKNNQNTYYWEFLDNIK